MRILFKVAFGYFQNQMILHLHTFLTLSKIKIVFKGFLEYTSIEILQGHFPLTRITYIRYFKPSSVISFCMIQTLTYSWNGKTCENLPKIFSKNIAILLKIYVIFFKYVHSSIQVYSRIMGITFKLIDSKKYSKSFLHNTFIIAFQIL